MKALHTFSIISLFGTLAISCFTAVNICGQTLILPSPSKVAEGVNACAGRSMIVASERWRVKKGDIVTIYAIHPFSEQFQWKYEWKAQNAKIIDGQGTREIRIKAGGNKTPGYINASGFVEVLLSAKSLDDSDCSLSATSTIMVGRSREFNGFPNVDEVQLSKNPLPACNDAGSLIVDVNTKASDPENDVLWFFYRVTGGKVIGTGARVKWDLTSLPVGEYTISVGVDDGFGVQGKTKTSKISIANCAN